MAKKIVVAIGTRPEAIKMAPLIKALKEDSRFECIVLSTGQHREMLDQILTLFKVKVDHDMDVMVPNQTLSSLTATILQKADKFLQENRCDRVLVHGDTTTSMAVSLAAFYNKIPVGHVEGGLRTHDIYSPWPEEVNRQINAVIADMHFVPTQQAKENLLKEHVASHLVYITGNTVIDALLWARNQFKDRSVVKELSEKFHFIDDSRKLLLVTGHRRENFGQGFVDICKALLELSFQKELQIVYPVHLNPQVKGPVTEILGGRSNIHLIAPANYLEFVYLMDKAHLILTDSGGIQEEAPSLGKPVLVMRDVTERLEAVGAGTVKLVGSGCDRIVSGVNELLVNAELYGQMSRAHNPYGDGNAVGRICEILWDRG